MKTVEDIESLIKQCREIETLINHLLKALEVEADNVVKLGTLALLAQQHLQLDKLYRDLRLKKTSVISPLVRAFLDEMAEICVAYDLVVSQEEYDSALRDN